MTERQKHFYRLYRSGYSMGQIARMQGVNKSTVCRTIARAENHLRSAQEVLRNEEHIHARNHVYNSGNTDHEEE